MEDSVNFLHDLNWSTPFWKLLLRGISLPALSPFVESTELPHCTLTPATGTAEGQLIEINSFDLRSETAEEPLGGLECWKYSDHIPFIQPQSKQIKVIQQREKNLWTSPCSDEGTLFLHMELKWWWYHQLETAQIFISLWQVGREMPQVKQTVSQMSLQIREGSSGDLLLEDHGAAAERHHPVCREMGAPLGCQTCQCSQAGHRDQEEPHITPWVFCPYLHFAFHWTEEMWVHEC